MVRDKGMSALLVSFDNSHLLNDCFSCNSIMHDRLEKRMSIASFYSLEIFKDDFADIPHHFRDFSIKERRQNHG
jgi:hypothetical protein